MSDPRLPEMLRRTVADFRRLLTLEARLVLEGVKRQAASKGRAIAMGAAGAFLVVVGLLFLLAAIAAALALVLPWWAALLIVAGVLVGGGGALVAAAVSTVRSNPSPLPPETRQQLQEDARWLLEQRP